MVKMQQTTRRRRRHLAGCALLVLALTACVGPGDELLEGAGPLVGWVDKAERLPPAPATTTTLPPVTEVADVIWYNDGLAVGEEGATPDEVAAQVLDAAEGTDRYVQAARVDIGRALPGIDVPGELPADVRYITSQLVFDRSERRLAEDPAAAFGFWLVEPYTQSRSVAQRAVLSVSVELAPDTDTADPESACERFEGRGRCEVAELSTGPAWWISEGGGETLVWYQEPHRYELTMRIGRTQEMMLRMAETMVPIASLGGDSTEGE